MTQILSRRNQTADLLKGIAVILMIQVHLMELFVRQEIYDSIIGQVSLFLGGPPAAPVFMAVMGYYAAKSNKTTTQLILRALKLIVMGFALNIGLNFHLFIKIATGKLEIDPLPYIFGVDILFLAGLSIVVLAILKLVKNHKLLIIPLVLLGLIFLNYILDVKTVALTQNYLIAFFYGKDIWWSYFPFIPWFAYPLLGFIFYLFNNNFPDFLKKYLWHLLIMCAIVVIVSFTYAMDIASNLQLYYHHDFLFFIYNTFFLGGWSILAFLIASRFSNPVLHYIEWLGKNVTATYVIQWLLIGNTATALYKTQNLFAFFGWLILILGLTSAGVWVWIRIVQHRK